MSETEKERLHKKFASKNVESVETVWTAMSGDLFYGILWNCRKTFDEKLFLFWCTLGQKAIV